MNRSIITLITSFTFLASALSFAAIPPIVRPSPTLPTIPNMEYTMQNGQVVSAVNLDTPNARISISPILKDFLDVLAKKLAAKSNGEKITLTFTSNKEVKSSMPNIFDPGNGPAGKYADYKDCVGDTWWAPVIAQVLCLPALWVY